jgi:hypothetical protein
MATAKGAGLNQWRQPDTAANCARIAAEKIILFQAMVDFLPLQEFSATWGAKLNKSSALLPQAG